MSKNILVVDDEPKIIEVVKSYLEASGYTIFTAENGRAAIDIFNTHPLSLILLDLMLPDISGEKICKTVRSTSNIPIIMLTAKVEEADMLKGLDIGADDYITKPFSLKALKARINAVLRRAELCTTIDTKVAFNEGDLTIDFESLTVTRGGNEITLTPNEFELLSTLVKAPNKVFTRGELIDVTFGYEYEGYDRTIDSHIKNLRKKIESDTKNPVYIKTIHGVGYKFGGE